MLKRPTHKAYLAIASSTESCGQLDADSRTIYDVRGFDTLEETHKMGNNTTKAIEIVAEQGIAGLEDAVLENGPYLLMTLAEEDGGFAQTRTVCTKLDEFGSITELRNKYVQSKNDHPQLIYRIAKKLDPAF